MSSFRDAIKSAMAEYLNELKQKLDGLTEAELTWQPSLDTNTIIWLAWHMARVEDNWINGVVGEGATIWESGDWQSRTGVADEGNGWGQTMDQVRVFPGRDINSIVAYYEAVREAGFKVIDSLTDADMDTTREQTRNRGPIEILWILGHVVVEESQHLGQIALIRGMIRGLNG